MLVFLNKSLFRDKFLDPPYVDIDLKLVSLKTHQYLENYSLNFLSKAQEADEIQLSRSGNEFRPNGFKDPEHELFVFCALMGYTEMANIFWRASKVP